MHVTFKNKTLWHIQGNAWTGDPFDMFVFSKERPTAEQIRQLYIEDTDTDIETEIEDFMRNHEVYKVWAEYISDDSDRV